MVHERHHRRYTHRHIGHARRTRASPARRVRHSPSSRSPAPSSLARRSLGRRAPDSAYCKVLGTVAPETDIELRLPTAWQRRLLHLGGAGLDGSIPNLDLNNVELQQGYALVASNGGHRDPTGGPTRFLNQPALIQDYAHGAIGKTVLFAKAIIRTYYGDSPRYSYFAGCSNGGRGAFNAAAKYAGEYDGVIAGAPTLNMAGLISGWVRAALLTAPSNAKMASMYGAELAQCDAVDGLADGIISNPRACRFDPATIACPAGVDNDSCLTTAEIQAVNTIRSDVELDNGKVVYSRLGLGNPSRGFGVFQPLGPPGSPTVASFGVAMLQYFVYSDPAYRPSHVRRRPRPSAGCERHRRRLRFFGRHECPGAIPHGGQEDDRVARYRGHGVVAYGYDPHIRENGRSCWSWCRECTSVYATRSAALRRRTRSRSVRCRWRPLDVGRERKCAANAAGDESQFNRQRPVHASALRIPAVSTVCRAR